MKKITSGTVLLLLALSPWAMSVALDDSDDDLLPIFDAHIHYLSLIHISEPTRPSP